MWKDIKEAPKDGTVVDLWLGKPWNIRKPAMVWFEPWQVWVPEDNIPEDPKEGDVYGTGSLVPTHFMLPPEAP